MYKKVYLIPIIILIFCVYFSHISLDNNTLYETGNTCGNIKQMGYAVEKDSWIYYSDPTGNGKYELKSCLFKKKMDGSQKQNLSNNVAYQINVVGDYVYYTNGDPGSIFKININGGNSKKLKSGYNSNLIVIGNTIYYKNKDKLCKMDTNGKKKRKLVNDVLEFSIDNNFIYFTNQSDKCLYKADLIGKNIKKLSDDYAKDINVENGWIYYWEFNDSKLYKLKDDGSQKIVISNDVCRNLNLYKGVLYYRNQTAHTSIYRVNVDGSERCKIIDGNIVNINIVNDFIVYYKVTEGEGYYRVNFDGGEQQIWE